MQMNYSDIIEPVARDLLGHPNPKLSSAKELRYGRKGSLSIDKEAGTWYDHETKEGGGVVDLIRREAGVSPREWLTQNGFQNIADSKGGALQIAPLAGSAPHQEHNYTDENGEVLFQVLRKGGGKFSQRSPDPESPQKWKYKVKGVRQVPYKLPELLSRKDETVCIVEGEKDVDRLLNIGLLATCNAGGAGKWPDELTPHFSGRHIIIVPDNDEPGKKHADLVTEKLSDVAASIKRLDLSAHWPQMPSKGDVSDFLDRYPPEKFKALLDHAEPVRNCFEPLTIPRDFQSQIGSLQRRPWIIDKHLLRGYISSIFAPGGVGKSCFQLTMAVSISTGLDLLGLGVEEQTNTLVINNEDDDAEIQRRICGIMQAHQITDDALHGRLFYFSGYGKPFLIAKQVSDGTVIQSPNVGLLQEFIETMNIGAIFIDPFISTHESPENDNTAIDKVVTQFKRLATDTKAAISLVHHTPKNSTGDSELLAGRADSGRGASSLKDAARCADTLCKMSKETAEKLGKDENERQRFIRLDTGKLNFALADGDAEWFQMKSICIPNGDWVGVPMPVNLKPDLERAKKGNGSRLKWTPTMVAEALHKIIGNSQDDEITFSEIEAKFMAENDVQRTQAKQLATMISKNEKEPSRIKIDDEYFDYWYSKEYITAPVVIHKRQFK